MIKNIMMTLSILMLCNSSLATDINVDTTPTVDYNEGVTVITIKDEGHDLVTLLDRSLYRNESYQKTLAKIRDSERLYKELNKAGIKVPRIPIELFGNVHSKEKLDSDRLRHIKIINKSSQLITTDDIQRCIEAFPEIENIKIKQRCNEGVELTQIQVDGKNVTIKRSLEGDISAVDFDTRPKNNMNTTIKLGKSNMDTGRIKRTFTPPSYNNPLEKK